MRDDQPRSEHEVFAALTTLGDPWLVLSDVPFGLFGRPRPGLAQIDFLLVHPRRGLCVLEVKGGEITIRDGIWYTRPRGGEAEALRRTPFAQAADQRYELQRFLWKHLSIPDAAMAHAVALPGCVVPGGIGPDAPRALVVDINDMQNMPAAIDRVMRQWRTNLALDEDSVERLVGLLKPSATLTIVLAATADITEKALERETRRQVRFTESQVEAYRIMLRRERTLVLGEAGTGKTVLAVERARRLSQTGLRTLLLCHRAGAFAFISTLLGKDAPARAFDPANPGILTAIHWGAFVKQLRAASGRKIPSPRQAGILVEEFAAAAEDVGLQFDALVVDEGQEFTPGQLEALTWLLDDPEYSPMYIFADPFQHSGFFTFGQHDRESKRGTYRWKPPSEMGAALLEGR